MIQLRFLRFAVVLLGILATSSRADELSSVPTKGTEKAEIKIVLRISKELFDDLTQDVVEMSLPIKECVEGMPLTGQASGEGRTSVEMQTSDESAEFLITMKGTGTASLRADVGPVIARLTSRAQFTSQKKFRFDGIQFHADETSTSSQNKTTIDRICAKRRGPVGRLIEHVGRRMADKATSEINSVAQEFSEDMLSQAFDELGVELLTELNQTTKFEETVKKYFPETETWKYHLATRPHYLLAGAGPPGASFSESLSGSDEQLEALMEMWLPLTPGQAALLELVGELDVAYDFLREFLPEEDAKGMAEDVKLIRRGDWSVIQFGLPKPKPLESPKS